MSNNGQNIWSTLRSKVKDGPMALSIFVIGVMAMVLGLIFTYSDYLSSLFGLQSLQTAFSVQVPGGEWIVKAMAFAPQVGQMVFMALYTLDTSRKWALAMALAWFALDFTSDVQYNSSSTLFPQTGGVSVTPTVGVAAGMNIMWFSVGAEMFLVAGSAIVLTLFADAIREGYRLWYAVGTAISEAKRDAQRGRGGGQGQGQHNNGNQRQQQQRNQGQRNNGNQQQNNRRNLPPPMPGDAMNIFRAARRDDD